YGVERVLEFIFFFQAEDGIRDGHVTGVQTCALPICKVRTMTRSVVERDAEGIPRAILSLSSDLSQVLGNEDALEINEERLRLLRSEERRVGKEWRSRGEGE